MLQRLRAVRYITPLREGGSLPAIVEADDGGLYVMKFAGAGQGARALVAEVIAGSIAQRLGLHVPNMALLDLHPDLARSEPDPEIQDLLRASAGINLGFRFLEGAFAYNSLLQPPVAASVASKIVWFDAYVTNVDRTPRNVNLLLAEDRLWLIDHGAALYFHHTWGEVDSRSRSAFPLIRDHVLLPLATRLPEADSALRPRLPDHVLAAIVDLVPEEWLLTQGASLSPAQQRETYVRFLAMRREAAETFVEEAIRAHARHL